MRASSLIVLGILAIIIAYGVHWWIQRAGEQGAAAFKLGTGGP
jgi:hypothetical protein